jgi:hypothetical protein
MENSRHHILYLFFSLALLCNIGLWTYSREIQARWDNVPPVPAVNGAKAFALSDQQLSYRTIGLMLQNLGNTGGYNVPLKDYDYDKIGKWLALEDKLDPRSDYVPLLAAYYYGATQNPRQLPPIVEYLAAVGRRPENFGGQRWRWLAQAVYLARWREKDLVLALQLAQELAEKWRPGMPLWVKQMPAFVMTATGDKKGAYALMLDILKDEAGKVPQAELNSTILFICQRILDKEEAAANDLCTTLPPSVK